MGGGGGSAEFFFSVTSKRHFPLMGPFYIFLLSRRGGGPGPLGPPPESATAISCDVVHTSSYFLVSDGYFT